MEEKKKSSVTHAVYLIKPEAMDGKRIEIRERITWAENRLLNITISADVTLSDKMVDRFFPNLSGSVLAMAKVYLVGKRCELGIIEGEDVIKKLRSICGESLDPSECTQGTIRHDFGSHIISGGSVLYYKNAIYYSQNKKDQMSDLVFARKLLNKLLNEENI